MTALRKSKPFYSKISPPELNWIWKHWQRSLKSSNSSKSLRWMTKRSTGSLPSFNTKGPIVTTIWCAVVMKLKDSTSSLMVKCRSGNQFRLMIWSNPLWNSKLWSRTPSCQTRRALMSTRKLSSSISTQMLCLRTRGQSTARRLISTIFAPSRRRRPVWTTCGDYSIFTGLYALSLWPNSISSVRTTWGWNGPQFGKQLLWTKSSRCCDLGPKSSSRGYFPAKTLMLVYL